MSSRDLLQLANLCRNTLIEGGAVCLDVYDPYTGEDRRLVISPSAAWNEPEASIMVAYEGSGCFFLEPGSIPTEFDLMGNGFPYHVALEVYKLLAHILRRQRCRLRQRSKDHN